MNRVRGFTLIELIVVLSILAVLAATAAPKFFDLQKEARKSALNGLRAAVASAAVMANGLAVSQGLSGNSAVTVEGSSVAMSGSFPTTAGILNAVRYDTGVFEASAPVPNTGATMLFSVKAATTPTACTFTYNAVTNGVSSAYVGDVTNSGC